MCIRDRLEDARYYVPLDSILYIDSVDKKTFFYDKHRVFKCKSTLAELEEKLENTWFIRISRNCIINLAFLLCTRSCGNHKLEAVMTNGERLIVGRTYREALVHRLAHYDTEKKLSLIHI